MSGYLPHTYSSSDPLPSPPRSSSSCPWYNPLCNLALFLSSNPSVLPPLVTTPPTTIDYNNLLPTTITTQGVCGACWAISAALSSQAALFAKYGTMPSVCVSEAVACSKNSYGCDGGWPKDAYEYLVEKGGDVWVDTCDGESFDMLYEALGRLKQQEVRDERDDAFAM